MLHPDEGTVHAWLDGQLSAEAGAELERHIATCSECAAAVAEARGLVAASSRILSALDAVPSGVIPERPAPVFVASPKVVRKRRFYDMPATRAAAAVLVVGAGAFGITRMLGVSERAGSLASIESAADSALPPVAEFSTAAPSPAAPPAVAQSSGASGAGSSARDGARAEKRVPAATPTLAAEAPSAPQVAVSDRVNAAPVPAPSPVVDNQQVAVAESSASERRQDMAVAAAPAQRRRLGEAAKSALSSVVVTGAAEPARDARVAASGAQTRALAPREESAAPMLPQGVAGCYRIVARGAPRDLDLRVTARDEERDPASRVMFLRTRDTVEQASWVLSAADSIRLDLTRTSLGITVTGRASSDAIAGVTADGTAFRANKTKATGC